MKQVWKAEPFRKFVMHLADGRHIRVEHRELLAMLPSGRTVAVYQPDESFNVVDLSLVTDLQIGGNGDGCGVRRRR